MKYTSENEDEYAAIVHMNFAFEFSSYEEYICFARGIGQVSSEELPKLFHSVVLPDAEEDTFALLINGRNLSEIIDRINSLGEAGIGSDESELTYFGLKSKQTGIKEILEMYGNITEIDTALFKKGDYEIVLKKKKSIANRMQNSQSSSTTRVIKKLGIRIVVVGIVMAIILLMIRLLEAFQG